MRQYRILYGSCFWLLLVTHSVHTACAQGKSEAGLTAESFQRFADRIKGLEAVKDPEAFENLGIDLIRQPIVGREKDHPEFLKQRERKTRLLLRGLSALHSRFDPKYREDNYPSTTFVSRDPEFNEVDDPNKIKDPVRRRAYEEELQKFRERLMRYHMQIAIHRE